MNEVNLFCFPFAGGNRYSYHTFQKLAPSWLNVITLELPGHGARITEPLLRDIEKMVDDLHRQLVPVLDRPYVFFGHSLGALLGYLSTKRIAQDENLRLPSHLFFSGCSAPSFPRAEKRHLLPQNEFVKMIRDFQGTLDEILNHPEFTKLFIPILRADFESIDNFKYSQTEPLDIPITVMIGSHEQMSLNEASLWRRETSSEFRIHQFAGRHFFIFDHTPAITNHIWREVSKIRE